MFEGYRPARASPQVALAERALRGSGYEPSQIVTGGGSDANALAAAGFPCTNLANGTERNHEPTERVSVDGAGRDARGRDRARRGRAGRDTGSWAGMSEIELLGEDVAWRGKMVRAGVARYRRPPTGTR